MVPLGLHYSCLHHPTSDKALQPIAMTMTAPQQWILPQDSEGEIWAGKKRGEAHQRAGGAEVSFVGKK